MNEIFGNTTTTPINPDAFSGGGGGSDIKVDQTYNPESENAQSGIAVAQAINGAVGDISTAFDELHAYAQALISGGDTE